MKTLVLLFIIVLSSCSNISILQKPCKKLIDNQIYIVHEVFNIKNKPGYYMLDIYSKDNPNQNYTTVITTKYYFAGDTLLFNSQYYKKTNQIRNHEEN